MLTSKRAQPLKHRLKRAQPLKHTLFAALSAEQLEVLDSLSEVVSLPAAETFVQEGGTSHDFYYIVEGSVEVLKSSIEGQTHQINKVGAGDLVGELALLEEGERSASLRTIEPTTLIRLAGDEIRKRTDLYVALAATIARTLSKRLRRTNEVTVRSMQAQLTSAKEQIAQGVIMVTIVLIMATYIFSQGIIALMKPSMPTTTPISVGMLVLFALISFVALKRTGYALSCYGLTLDKWQHVTKTAVLYSLPVMGMILLAKWLAISFVPALAGQPLIHPFAVLTKMQGANRWSYLMIPLAYAAFCPIQEFIVRGALQSSFQLFLKSEQPSSIWTAILLSNLLFSATHVHTTFAFAVLAFVPGLFWGWLYAKQGSLIGVSVSHILIGFWAVFIVSFSHLL